MRENSYGRAKRLGFVAHSLSESGVRRVLDIGCGTGAELTIPLAERLPGTDFLAVDEDPASVAAARAATVLPNLRFTLSAELDPLARFDAVIASEVLEHVDPPEDFLAFLNERLVPGGLLVLTTPNGFGPFEVSQIVETGLWSTGLLGLLRRAKRAAVGGVSGPAADDTLAVSPHVNFFTRADVARLLEQAGFAVRAFRPRTFLCGFGFDHLLKGERAIAWNARVADRLPSGLTSDFMFLAEKAAPPRSGCVYRRGLYARLRGAANRRRMGL